MSRLPTTPEPKPPTPEPAGPPSASPPSPDVAPSGETNEYIRWVQTSLNQVLGLQLPANGMMGVETRSAIRSFQEKNGLPADGMVGPDTERALLAARGGQANGVEPPAPEEFEALASELEDFEWEEEVNRSSREYAIWVQQSLNKILSLRLDVDGIIGTMTRAAIRDFQQQKGLIPDGIVGPMTEAALMKAGASAPPQGGTIPTPGTGGTSANINTQLPLSGPGFYSKYGNDPAGRAHQYGLPKTIQALQAIGAAWYRAHPQGPRIGINHISLRGGGDTPHHATHENGLDVDIRPVTNNGVEMGVDYKSPQYSRSLTQELVNLIRSNRVLKVRTILFNDPSVTGVSPSSGHDDHLHVSFLPPVPASGGGTATPVALQPYVPVQPATSGAALRNNIVTIAVKEWERWGKGTITESDSRMRFVLEDYWRTGVGWVPSDPMWWSTWAWSAAFISWVMRKAGAGAALAYHFGQQLHSDMEAIELDDLVREYLLSHTYSGNVRDLRQLVARIIYRHVGSGPITVGDIPEEERPAINLLPDWPDHSLENAIQRALAGGVGLKEISRAVTEAAIRIAVRNEEGNLQRAARKLRVTDRALQLRRAARREPEQPQDEGTSDSLSSAHSSPLPEQSVLAS